MAPRHNHRTKHTNLNVFKMVMPLLKKGCLKDIFCYKIFILEKPAPEMCSMIQLGTVPSSLPFGG